MDILGIVKIVKFEDVFFDESARGRLDYGDIEELARSIKEQGLIQPISVYSPNLTPPYELLTGGRRYKALQLLDAALVSVRIYDHELSEREKRIIELFENLKRKELNHIETARLTSMFHTTLQEIHGKALPGSAMGHSTRDTARLLGVSQQTVNNNLKLAKAHEAFPELALDQRKNAAAALHTVNRLEYITKSRVANPSIDSSTLGQSYKIGNFFEVTLPEGEFNFIEIDPPYGIDLHVVKKMNTSEGYVEVAEDQYDQMIQELIKKCTTASADDAYLIIWCPPQHYYVMYHTLLAYGWDVDHVFAVWVKTNSTGQTRSPEYWLGGAHEPWLYAKRGNARIIKEGRSNVFAFPVVDPRTKSHPTEKPLELMKEILNTFCLPGYSILVPFAGSGVTLAAAYDLGCKAIGYDLNSVYREEFLAKFGGTRR